MKHNRTWRAIDLAVVLASASFILRQCHLIRPDLIPYPIDVSTYC